MAMLKRVKVREYEGTDSLAAAMLELGVLDSTPGVRWDVVAVFSEAKHITNQTTCLIHV
ncbi:unnamed protein product [Arabidopsis halleri]